MREADRAEAYAWSVQMEPRSRRQRGQCINGGLGCSRSSATAVRPAPACRLMPIRRPRDTPIWKLEAALKCRSCRKWAPPVHMIKLTETREITPYKWVHPD